MTRNVATILAQTHGISITVLYRIITHVRTLENHRLTAYLYKHYCFYKIIIAKLLALNVLSIALYTCLLKISTILIYYKTICHVMH